MKRLSHWAPLFAVPLFLAVSLTTAGAGNAPFAKAKPGLQRLATKPTGTIAFVRSNACGHQKVWLMNADGSYQRAITPPTMNVGYATISPDGRRVAFGRQFASPGWVQNDIYVINVNGTGLRRLTTTKGNEEALTWSPDGRRIAYASSYMTTFNPPQRSDIWVMNADGSGKHRLTRTAPLESSPSRSPDGKRIAYARGSGIWLMTAHGHLRHPITSPSVGFDYFPAWTPDGSRIAFARSRGGGLGDIWLMQAAGSHSVQLTSNSRDDTRPCWSPDGRWLAFASDRRPRGVYHIWVMRSDSTGLRRLTAGRTGEYSPSWSRASTVAHSTARAPS